VQRRSCVRGELRALAGEHDLHAVPPLLQMSRDDERVAPVVAGAGEYHHRLASIGDESTRELSGGRTRALHQARYSGDLLRQRFELADLIASVDGKSCSYVEYRHDPQCG
jgi:hypothetical protein